MRSWRIDLFCKQQVQFPMVSHSSLIKIIPLMFLYLSLLLLKNWPSSLPILTAVKTANQTFIKLWNCCKIPVKSLYKKYNRHTILHEAWCPKDIAIHCKNVILFYKLNFLIIFPFIPSFYNFPIFGISPYVVEMFAFFLFYPILGKSYLFPLRRGRGGLNSQNNIKSCIIYKINSEITKIDTISAKLTIFTWFWSLSKWTFYNNIVVSTNP